MIRPRGPHAVEEPQGDDDYVVPCPHCYNDPCAVEQVAFVPRHAVNCRIFRHAVYILTNKPMPPHTRKEECDRAAAEGEIVGCGKPFWFDGNVVKACDYI